MAPSVFGYRPSEWAFHFANAFPPGTPAVAGLPSHIPVPGDGDLAINDASNGLCGGMALASRDYWEANRRTPPDTSPPAQGTPLFDFLVRRLIDSFNLPWGPLRYLQLMNPWLPDQEAWVEPFGHGRAWIMVNEEWPKIHADLSQANLTTLGLVRVKSWKPMDISHNHQVLAYGYEFQGDTVVLSIYDPNLPDRDDVTISFDTSDPDHAVTVECSDPDPEFPVLCFFKVEYQAPAVPLPPA